MAQPTNTYDSYDGANGNREDIADIIFDISPEETPFLSAIKKTKASATLHQWVTDSLDSPSATNAHVDGDDAQPGVTNAPNRYTNNTQILKKHVVVSGTQEKVKKVGRNSEVAYQLPRKLLALRTDCESSMIGGAAIGNPKVGGSDSVAREMGSIYTYLTSNLSLGSGTGAASTGDGSDAMVAGTARPLTEGLLTTVLSSCYSNGGKPSLLFVSPTNRAIVSSFAGNGTRYVSTDDKKLTTSIDVYEGDFATLKVMPSRHIASTNVLAIDPEMVAAAELRPVDTYDLAKTGDSYRKEVVWETTLEVCNEAAHGLIADTQG